ncbi:neuronal PAS domain-containing protein 2-like isoform X3 [Cherax quadricarinatus]
MNARDEQEDTDDTHSSIATGGTNTSTSSTSTTVAATVPQTTSTSASMGGEHKYPSSSREMRNMAEKLRRDKLNNYVNELAGIVPLGSGANKRIDKTSVLRLAANYIRMHKILKDDEETERVPTALGGAITHNLAEAVGGFLLVVTSTGKVVYITEAVDQFFGHSQVDLLGHNIFSVIHPDDHEIFQQQLTPRENSRRSFFCRMMEKALSRNDPGRYEIIHVVGQVRPIPQSATFTPCVLAPSPNGTVASSDHDDEDESDADGDSQSTKVSSSRIGTHMLVSFIRVVKDRPITELSLVESTQDEYITRHGMDGKILYTDHRISFVTGLMPTEVIGTSAFNYMHPDDMMWSVVAQKLMFISTCGQGIVSYRLKCRDGSHVTLRSRGYLEVNKQTGQVESFVCINTVLSIKEGVQEIKNQRRKLLPIVTSQESDEHLGTISSSLPPELMMVLKQMMNTETIKKMIESVDSVTLNVEDRAGTHSDIPDRRTSVHKLTREDYNEISPFQTKQKKICGFDDSVSPECSDRKSFVSKENTVRDVDESQWHSVPCKTKSTDSFNAYVTTKFTFDRETHQLVSSEPQETSSPTSQLCPSTSTLNQGNGNCSQNPDKKVGSGDLAYPKSPQNNITGLHQQNKSDRIPSQWVCEEAKTYEYPKAESIEVSASSIPHRNESLPSAKASRFNSSEGMLSPGSCQQNVIPGVPSPGTYDHCVTAGMSISSQSEEISAASVPSDSLKNKKERNVSISGNYPKTCDTLPSAGNYEHSAKNMAFSSSHIECESYVINPSTIHEKYSSNVMAPACNYQAKESNKMTYSRGRSLAISQRKSRNSETFRIQPSQHLHQQYHQQQQPITENNLRYSTSPEFDIKMQRSQQMQQKLHNPNESQEKSESKVNYVGSPASSSQCLPYGTTVALEESGGGVYRYPATAASPERGLSVQCNANFQLNTAHPVTCTSTMPGTTIHHSQHACVKQLRDHSDTEDVDETVVCKRERQVYKCHSLSTQGEMRPKC